jgi:hypothetical protein
VHAPATQVKFKPGQVHIWPQPLSTPHCCGQLGVHPHRPAVPPPPQVSGDVQSPQGTVPPQPFGAVLQFCPAGHACAAVSGVQPHTLGMLGVPPWHVCGDMHVPQVIVPPQPFGTVPQFLPPEHAADIDTGVQPHTFGVPPPWQVSGAVHVPQVIVPPQPSDTVPQFLPPAQAAAIDSRVHPHTLGTPGFPMPHI